MEVQPISKDLGLAGEDSTIDRIDGDGKVDGVKSQIDSQAKLSKIKNKIRLSLAKIQLLVEPNSGLCFLTQEAKLTFVELRRIFIKALTFHHFDLKCHICVEIDFIDYAIYEVPS